MPHSFYDTAIKWPLVILLMYLSPYIVLSQNAYVIIADGLDSAHLWHVFMARHDLYFSASETVMEQMANMPRLALGSEWNVGAWFYAVLPPYTAFLFNLITVHTIAFFSAFVFFQRYILKDAPRLAGYVALCFALLPHWSYGGLSVAAMPLVLYAFLNFYHQRHGYADWAIIVLIPFYSSFILSMMFFLSVPSCMLVYFILLNRRVNTPLFIALCVMTCVYLLVDYRLFMFVLDPFFISHRTAFVKEGYDLYGMVRASIKNFLYGQYHANPLALYVIFPTTLGVLIYSYLRHRIIGWPLIGLLCIIGVTALIYGAWEWKPVVDMRDDYFVTRSIQFDRFHFLQPLLWVLVFAYVLKELYRRSPRLVYGLIILQLAVCFWKSDFLKQRDKAPVTYAQFYAVEQFDAIKSFINKPVSDYRVVSVGMHPSIALYNGFYTADFYLPNYPLDYKNKFRPLIAGELKKNDEIRDYFDHWGSRAYAYSAENGRDFFPPRKNGFIIHDFYLDKNAARDLGVEYVLSKSKIEKTNLTFIKMFEHPNSAWTVYLYKI